MEISSAPPTINDIRLARLGIRKLELASHNKEAQCLNRILCAYLHVLNLAEDDAPYPISDVTHLDSIEEQ